MPDAPSTVLPGKFLDVRQDGERVYGETDTDGLLLDAAELRELAAEALAAAKLIEDRAAVKRIS